MLAYQAIHARGVHDDYAVAVVIVGYVGTGRLFGDRAAVHGYPELVFGARFYIQDRVDLVGVELDAQVVLVVVGGAGMAQVLGLA